MQPNTSEVQTGEAMEATDNAGDEGETAFRKMSEGYIGL